MATLATLPTEVLLMIAKASTGQVQQCPPVYAGGPTVPRGVRILEQGDLLNLTYVCRRFNTTFNEVLYKYNMDYKDFHAITRAVSQGNIETLELIRHLKLNLHYHEQSGMPCHTLRVASICTQQRMAEWLLQNGAAYEQLVILQTLSRPMALEDSSVLSFAMNTRQEDMSLLLLSHGASPYFILQYDIPIDGEDPSSQFETALHVAARTRSPELVEYLVRKIGLPVDVMNSREETPLYEYFRGLLGLPYIWYDFDYDSDAENGEDEEDVTMLELFIRLGADINFERHNELLLLTHALHSSFYDHANVLLDAGAKVKPDMRKGRGIPEPINACVRYRPTSLTAEWEALQKRDILGRLIEGGIDPNERLEGSYTPLEEAVLGGLPETVADLVEFGASIGQSLNGGNILDFFLSHYDELFPYDLTFKKAESIVECGARIDVPLVTTGESFLVGVIECYAKEEGENEFDSPIEALISAAVAQTGIDQDHLHYVLEKQVTYGGSLRDAPKRVQICNELVSHGAVLKEASFAGAAASMFIGGNFAGTDNAIPPTDEEQTLFDSFLAMTPKRYLDGLLTRAQGLEDNISTPKILKRMAEERGSELNEVRDSVCELGGELSQLSVD